MVLKNYTQLLAPGALYGSTDEAIQGWVSSNTQYIAVKIKFTGQDKLPMSQYKSQEKSGYGLLTIARAP